MKKFAIVSLISMFFLSGCMLNLEERKDNTEYGSLSCGDISRSIDVESIKSAKVTVTGPGIKYEISTICDKIKSGIVPNLQKRFRNNICHRDESLGNLVHKRTSHGVAKMVLP